MICSTWWAAAFASLCIGGCSADCTIVEGHECCSFAAGDSQAQECGRISPGVLTGDGKHACGQHCMEDDLCFWTYSAGGDYAGGDYAARPVRYCSIEPAGPRNGVRCREDALGI